MSFTPGLGNAVLVGSTEPAVTLDITPPSAPPNTIPTMVTVTVNPGQSYEWSGNAPITGGNFTAYGFRAISGSPGQNNIVNIVYKYAMMPSYNPCEQNEGHNFYLYT